jgi:S1-C subfamily serine protease
VPIDRLKPLVSPHRGWFSDRSGGYAAYAGIELEEVAGSEIRVLGVSPDGPAAAAGLGPGSRIVKINGEAVSSLEAFARLFGDQPPNRRLVLEIVIEGETRTVGIALWARF